jgi:hypothetical protein
MDPITKSNLISFATFCTKKMTKADRRKLLEELRALHYTLQLHPDNQACLIRLSCIVNMLKSQPCQNALLEVLRKYAIYCENRLARTY